MSRYRGVIALLSIIWVAVVPALLCLGFWHGFSPDGTTAAASRQGGWMMLTAVALGVGLPLAITVVATLARRFVMAGVFLVVTALLTIPAVTIVTESIRQVRHAAAT